MDSMRAGKHLQVICTHSLLPRQPASAAACVVAHLLTHKAASSQGCMHARQPPPESLQGCSLGSVLPLSPHEVDVGAEKTCKQAYTGKHVLVRVSCGSSCFLSVDFLESLLVRQPACMHGGLYPQQPACSPCGSQRMQSAGVGG